MDPNYETPNPWAFPLRLSEMEIQSGMTLRDYFAAKALSLYSHPDVWTAIESMAKSRNMSAEAGLAAAVYALADAMLAERSK